MTEQPRTTLVLTPLCMTCETPKGNPLRCGFLPYQRDGVQCVDFTQSKSPMRYCGYCAYYKTPKCESAGYESVIKKSDPICSGFFLDRHMTHLKTKKPKVLQKRVE